MAHCRGECKSQGVFSPQFRRTVLDGALGQRLGEGLHELARHKECRSIEGHLRPEHVHRCIEMPPKYALASGRGGLKGKRALASARRVQEKESNFTGEHFGARG